MKKYSIYFLYALLSFSQISATDSKKSYVTLVDGTTMHISRYACINTFLHELTHQEMRQLIYKCLDDHIELSLNLLHKGKRIVVNEDGELFSDAKRFILLAWTDTEGNIQPKCKAILANHYAKIALRKKRDFFVV